MNLRTGQSTEKMTLTNIFLVLLFQIPVVLSSHYRGSMITWRVINSTSNPLIIELFHRHTWSYAWYPCTAAQIASGNYTIGVFHEKVGLG